MRATFDETVELGDGRTGTVESISTQLVTPFTRRYFVRLNGHGADAPVVEVPETAITRAFNQYAYTGERAE